MGSDKNQNSFAGIIIFLCLLLVALLLFLAFREGKMIDVVDDPTLGTIHSCSSFCRGQCFSSLYDRVNAKVLVEGTSTRCVCQCTNSLNVWLRGEPIPPEEFSE